MCTDHLGCVARSAMTARSADLGISVCACRDNSRRPCHGRCRDMSSNPSWTGAGPLKYIISHVCMLPKLPQVDATSITDELHRIKSLCGLVKDFKTLESASAVALSPVIGMPERLQARSPVWRTIMKDNTAGTPHHLSRVSHSSLTANVNCYR